MAVEQADPESTKLTEGHHEALKATDVYFGGFCALMTVVTSAAWLQGRVTWRTPATILGFLVANVVLSQFSLRRSNTYAQSYAIERGRAASGAVIGPAAYLLVEGPFVEPWWPAFLIMSLGGAIVLGLLTGSPFWGRVLVIYYLGLMAASELFGPGEVDWYSFYLHGGVLAMVGLLFAEIMSLLGRSFRKERERTEELRAARDALFAEMEVAHKIQTLLLPTRPMIPENMVEGRMLPAEIVGGDYYDVITTGDRAFLAIGDVSGHGVTSGLAMMMVRSSLIGVLEADATASLAEVYVALNKCLCTNLKRMKVNLHMTLNVVEYLGDGRFSAVGLHLPMLAYRAKSGKVEEFESEGIWLGLLEDIEIESVPEMSFSLEADDLLFLYTDGITEHFKGREMYGEERLTHVFRENASQPLDKIIDAVVESLDAFSQEPRRDDVTMLVVNHRGDMGSSDPNGGSRATLAGFTPPS